MALYTGYGSEIEIVGIRMYESMPGTLSITAKRKDDGKEIELGIGFVRADGGLPEIITALRAFDPTWSDEDLENIKTPSPEWEWGHDN